ncbi:MAG: hypothetical protein GF417_00705 [Candidatus Latescibacteria bacterium]|nr:hypothetical protein [bacterium]MBD3422946.1 hypothetical protein [Candidatus Latescibacterota bacterium]
MNTGSDKLAVFVIFLALLSSGLSAHTMRREIILREPAGSLESFSLRNRIGSVETEVWDRDSIVVKARLKIRAPSKSEAEELLGETELGFSRNRGTLIFDPKLPTLKQYGIFSYTGTVRSSLSINCTVKVPIGLDIDIEVVSGDIILAKAENSYKLVTERGDITVDGPGQSAGAIRVGRGNINCRIYGSGWAGRLSAECGTGDVRVLFPESSDLVLELYSVRGGVNFQFEDIEPDLRRKNSVMAVFGVGKGRITLGSFRGEVTAGDIIREHDKTETGEW